MVVAGARRPNDSLYTALVDREPEWQAAGIATVSRLGDCDAPGAIVHAVNAGHRYARELDAEPAELVFRSERIKL